MWSLYSASMGKLSKPVSPNKKRCVTPSCVEQIALSNAHQNCFSCLMQLEKSHFSVKNHKKAVCVSCKCLTQQRYSEFVVRADHFRNTGIIESIKVLSGPYASVSSPQGSPRLSPPVLSLAPRPSPPSYSQVVQTTIQHHPQG